MPHVETAIQPHAAGNVAVVTLCNAAKLNILNSPLTAELTAAIVAAGADSNLRALVLRGDGARAFIGGADIREMAALTPWTGRAFILALHGLCAAIRACPVPVIARLEGFTLGAGLEVAAACDMRVAAEGSRFGMPETRIGIPSVIEAALLPQLIGWGRTRRILFTGEIFDAATADKWGFLEELVPAEDLDAAIGRIVADILACGPRAIRLQKTLINAWEELTPSSAIAAGVDCFEESWRTDEPAKLMAAFLAGKKNG